MGHGGAGAIRDLPERPYYLHLFKTGWAIGLTGLLLQPFTGLSMRTGPRPNQLLPPYDN